ncbi:MAG: hypothetical protein H6510_17825 [Acidobacteria bacterium]|nr:hypothetical protein [Acidobacteriota bacterium]
MATSRPRVFPLLLAYLCLTCTRPMQIMAPKIEGPHSVTVPFSVEEVRARLQAFCEGDPKFPWGSLVWNSRLNQLYVAFDSEASLAQYQSNRYIPSEFWVHAFSVPIQIHALPDNQTELSMKPLACSLALIRKSPREGTDVVLLRPTGLEVRALYDLVRNCFGANPTKMEPRGEHFSAILEDVPKQGVAPIQLTYPFSAACLEMHQADYEPESFTTLWLDNQEKQFRLGLPGGRSEMDGNLIITRAPIQTQVETDSFVQQGVATYWHRNGHGLLRPAGQGFYEVFGIQREGKWQLVMEGFWLNINPELLAMDPLGRPDFGCGPDTLEGH